MYCNFVEMNCSTIFYLLFFLSLFCSFVFAEDEEVHCDTYKTLTRIPNPFATRGTKCCNNLGCFSNEKSSSNWSHVSELPECMDKIKPEFTVFTSKNIEEQRVDFFKLTSTVSNLHVDDRKELFVIIHGWNTKWPNNFMFPMKEALLNLSSNVMIVRWTEGSNLTNYIQAVANMRSVGAAVAVVLQAMVDHKKVKLDSVTIIGFSLGAHAAGLAGSRLPGLKRIIGLDPAGPLFACQDPEVRLDESDAKFVQIFHTNGETVLKLGHGTMQQMGHVDFYVNGGVFQQDCDEGVPQTITDVLKLNLTAVWKSMSCSHHRSHDLLIEMIQQMPKPDKTKCKFLTFSCNDSASWINGQCFEKTEQFPEPGLALDFGTKFRGKYFFNVRFNGASAQEFCGQQYRMSLTSDMDVKGDLFLVVDSLIGDTVTVKFQNNQETLPANTLISRIIVLPKYFIGIKQILLSYSKYTSRLWADGINNFVLKNASITNTEEKTWYACSRTSITSGNPTKIEFNNCT